MQPDILRIRATEAEETSDWATATEKRILRRTNETLISEEIGGIDASRMEIK